MKLSAFIQIAKKNATNAKSLLSIFKMKRKDDRRNIETMQGLKKICTFNCIYILATSSKTQNI